METFNNEQISFEGIGFDIDPEIVLANKVRITDFFGDNRNFYEELRKGSSTLNRVNLDSSEDYDVDLDPKDMKIEDRDSPPLNPELINEKKAQYIANFFVENKTARIAFLKYISVEEGKI